MAEVHHQIVITYGSDFQKIVGENAIKAFVNAIKFQLESVHKKNKVLWIITELSREGRKK